MKVSIKKLHEAAKVPSYAHGTDAGMDLYAFHGALVSPGHRHMVDTHIAMAIPAGYVGLIWDKSGLAAKQGVKVMGGVIDAGYRGEIKVCIINTSDEILTIEPGQKIAQMLIQPVVNPHIEIVDGDLPAAEDDRGEGGFGSTGLK